MWWFFHWHLALISRRHLVLFSQMKCFIFLISCFGSCLGAQTSSLCSESAHHKMASLLSFLGKCISFHLNTPAIRLARLFVRNYRVGCDASDSSLLLQHTPRVAPPLASVGDKVAGRTRHSAPAAGRLAAFRSEISKWKRLHRIQHTRNYLQSAFGWFSLIRWILTIFQLLNSLTASWLRPKTYKIFI